MAFNTKRLGLVLIAVFYVVLTNAQSLVSGNEKVGEAEVNLSMDVATSSSAEPITSVTVMSLQERQKLAAAQGQNLRIGFINFRRIMASIPQLKTVSESLEREFASQKSTLVTKQQDLAEMEQHLSTLERGDAYSDYEKQVIAKRRDFVREEASYRDAYSVRRNEEVAKLQRIVVDEIVALAKELDFDVILNDTGVIYVSEDADLTAIMIERLRSRGE